MLEKGLIRLSHLRKTTLLILTTKPHQLETAFAPNIYLSSDRTKATTKTQAIKIQKAANKELLS